MTYRGRDKKLKKRGGLREEEPDKKRGGQSNTELHKKLSERLKKARIMERLHAKEKRIEKQKQLKKGELVKTPEMKIKKGKNIQKYEEGGVVETKQYAHSAIDELIKNNG